MGHSGARIELLDDLETVRKQHPDAAAEARHISQLGYAVCPQIMAVGEDWYTMERLKPAERHEGMLRDIEYMLSLHVWRRQGGPHTSEWCELLQTSLGVVVPAAVFAQTRDIVLIHGDPTIANLMHRDDADGNSLVLIDPKPSGGRIPWMIDVDRGKMLQSMCGWEVMLGMDVPLQLPPKFVSDEATLARSMWWLHVHALRIKQREMAQEARPEILEWATRVARGAHDAAGL